MQSDDTNNDQKKQKPVPQYAQRQAEETPDESARNLSELFNHDQPQPSQQEAPQPSTQQDANNSQDQITSQILELVKPISEDVKSFGERLDSIYKLLTEISEKQDRQNTDGVPVKLT